MHRLLKSSGYPGMKVLQFAFDPNEDSSYLPHYYPHNCVVYTGTHDNTTTRGWLDTQEPEVLQLAKDYLGFEAVEDGPWAFIRGALESVADLAVIPLQDYLCLLYTSRCPAAGLRCRVGRCWTSATGRQHPRQQPRRWHGASRD